MSLFGFRKPTPTNRFRYAVVGLGHIATCFLEALKDSPTCAITALISGDEAKASKLAKKYNIPHATTYNNFEAICQNVDAVYIALPVSLHREYTERAAAAGKHILCEKPMAPTSHDAQAMIAACAAANVRLSIAYRCPFDPTHQRARDLVQTGALGLPASLRIESAYGFRLKPGWRDNPALAGGGSLYDVGIYPLNATRYLLKEAPASVQKVTLSALSGGLEREITWINTFETGAEATCTSSYDRVLPDTLRITGDRGWLLLDPAFTHRGRLRLRASYTDPTTGARTTLDEPSPKNLPSHFRLEAEHLAHAVQTNTGLITPGEDGLADMLAMEQIYAAAGIPQKPVKP